MDNLRLRMYCGVNKGPIKYKGQSARIPHDLSAFSYVAPSDLTRSSSKNGTAYSSLQKTFFDRHPTHLNFANFFFFHIGETRDNLVFEDRCSISSRNAHKG